MKPLQFNIVGRQKTFIFYYQNLQVWLNVSNRQFGLNHHWKRKVIVHRTHFQLKLPLQQQVFIYSIPELLRKVKKILKLLNNNLCVYEDHVGKHCFFISYWIYFRNERVCISGPMNSFIKKIPHTGDKESLDRCGPPLCSRRRRQGAFRPKKNPPKKISKIFFWKK